MNKVNSLIRGVGVVIDDHVFDWISKDAADRCAESFAKKGVPKKDVALIKSEYRNNHKDDIVRIVDAFEKAGIPLVKYDKVPDNIENVISNINQAAFVLVDWTFHDVDFDEDGNPIKSLGVEDNDQEYLIKFIKSVLELCVVPIFVFCNEPSDARNKLTAALGEESTSRLLIKRKSSVVSRVVETIENWYKSSPSTYVLKVWDNIYHGARFTMFRDFSKASPYWPSSLYKAYDSDDDDPGSAFTELLLRNLRGRMLNVSLGEEHMTRKRARCANSTIRSVLELSVITPAESLAKDGYGCGDLYVCQDVEGPLYQLNVRCDCDLCHSDNPDFLLLNGREVDLPDVRKNKLFSTKDGFVRPLNCAYVFPVNNGKCVCFKFNDYKRVKAKAFLKQTQGSPSAQPKLLGRMLPPYITDIRQRNAQWMQREGFPKIPHQALK